MTLNQIASYGQVCDQFAMCNSDPTTEKTVTPDMRNAPGHESPSYGLRLSTCHIVTPAVLYKCKALQTLSFTGKQT